MEKEVQARQAYKFNLIPNNLEFIRQSIKFHEVYLIDDIDIDPFVEFSLLFRVEYWYLKYHLLLDGKFLLDDDIVALFNEDNLNINFFKITDFDNFLIECTDGNWKFTAFERTKISEGIFESLKNRNLI